VLYVKVITYVILHARCACLYYEDLWRRSVVNTIGGRNNCRQANAERLSVFMNCTLLYRVNEICESVENRD